MKIFYLLFVVILFLAQSSAIQITPSYPTNIIVRDLNSSIPLTLNVTGATPGYYNLYTLSDMLIQPSETFYVNTTSFIKTFIIKPNSNLNIKGNYAFRYTLNHRGFEKYNKEILLKLLDIRNVIEISSGSITPGSSQISFYIKNKEPTYLKNITATFSSILFNITKTFNLKPDEKLVIPVKINSSFMSRIPAGVYVITGKFHTTKGEKTIKGNLYLGEKKGIVSIEDNSGFLIRTETITKVNSGNVVETIKVKMQRNIFSRFFTTFNIKPTLTERSGMGVNYIWIKRQLNPAESYTVKAKTNYVFPLLIIIVLAVVIFGYMRFIGTKLEIRKSVIPVKTKGGEFALKVTLSLKAREDVENVTLSDKIPSIVKIYKKFSTAKPDKVDAERRRIHWNIGSLKAGEERSFTYIIYSKVGIVGKFSLPRAVANFEQEGEMHEIDSNNIFFMNEQISG